MAENTPGLCLIGGSREGGNFSMGFAHNPLKSPDSDDQIQANPSILFGLAWLGLGGIALRFGGFKYR
jgi:hypothetical protein